MKSDKENKYYTDCISRNALRLKMAETPRYTESMKNKSARRLKEFLIKEEYLEDDNDIQITPNMCKGFTMAIECLKETINSLPSVTPAYKTELKEKTYKWTPGDEYCPCCGESKFKDLDADIWSDWYPKYCPNCGAYMIENEE